MRLSFFLLAFLCTFSSGYTQDAESIISKVKAKLEKVNDYASKGSISLDVEFIKIPTSRVEMFYKKPDKIRIKSADGLSILPKGGFSVNLQALLSSGQYSAVKIGNSKFNGLNVETVKLIPLSENSDLLVATLYIDSKDYLIQKSITTTKTNGTVEMEMVYGAYAQWGLPDKITVIFSTKDYKLPKGISFDYNPSGNAGIKKTSSGKGKVEVVYETYQVNKGVNEQVFK